jgi:hypothetical protein
MPPKSVGWSGSYSEVLARNYEGGEIDQYTGCMAKDRKKRSVVLEECEG